jgi:hypothetical protein
MMKTLVATGVCAAAVLSVSAPAQAATSSCGTLPSQVQGNPDVRAGQDGAAYLFHDSKGWSVRVTHASSKGSVVTGTITATGLIGHVSTFHLEKRDAVRLSNGGHTLQFRLVNVGHLDGLSFTAECSKSMRVAIGVDGKGASTQAVYLGAHRLHPASVPFAIERH